MSLRVITIENTTRKTAGLLLLAFSVTVIGFDVRVQDSGENERNNRAGALEEVVVSARKRDENLQDVPISIAVFSE